MAFAGTDKSPHFDWKAFRVKKKIFATLDEKNKRIMAKLPLADQSVFCSFDKTVIYPVPGGWGLKGATYINIGKIKRSMFKDAFTVAYCLTAPSKLTAEYLLK